jgi:RNA polymerase sigma-70 factor (ECF subfamily)
MAMVAEPKILPVAEAKAGDPEAWDVLFRRYQLPLYSYVCELVRDEQASLDIVQETFIGATRHLAGLRDDSKFGSWLFGIAHQKCIQRWRRREREEDALVDLGAELPESEPDPAALLLRQEQEDLFLELVAQLPPPQRAVLLLSCLEDLSIDEIASVTGAAPGTVKSRLHYGRKALRRLWEDEHEETP